MLGFNADLQSQTGHLAEILKLNGTLYSVIEKAAGIGLQNYYIGAGCVTQTVWNYQMGFELTHGISDIDFVYYDGSDLSFEAEDSVEDAINSWPTTATAIGVRLVDGNFKVYAPFGLNDLFGMVVKANKVQITEEIYMQKVNKWSSKWSALTIIP